MQTNSVFSLIKDSQLRPKPAELLKRNFIKQYTVENVDVAGYVEHVLKVSEWQTF